MFVIVFCALRVGRGDRIHINEDCVMNIYVSNIPYTATDEQMRDAFAQFGTVTSARIIRDRMTGRSRGFGFVEMSSDEEGRKAIESLNGAEMAGRKINAREARPREEVGGGGDRGGDRGGYGGGGDRGGDRGGYGGGGGRGGYGGGGGRGGYGGGGGRGDRGGYGGGGDRGGFGGGHY